MNSSGALIKNFKLKFYFVLNIFGIGMDRLASKNKYIKLNEKIERLSKWFYFALIYTSFGGCGLASIAGSYINYHVFGLGDGSFLVPTPLMYVCVI